jgi:uncharacterized protein (DUF305 family)
MTTGRVGVDDEDALGIDGQGDDGTDDRTNDRDSAGRGGGAAHSGEGDGGDDDFVDTDDTIVLPWWQRPFNIAVIAVTTALLAGMIGWMIGDSDNGRDADPVDVGFLQDMRVHHEQAVAMSFLYLALDDTQPGLREVARSIAFGQGIEIGRMVQLLRDFGASEANEGETSMEWMGHSVPIAEMPGMATDAEFDELGATTGAAADSLFVELMVRHHRGGIEMATFAAAEAKDDEVRSMARSIVSSQRDEITELERLVD